MHIATLKAVLIRYSIGVQSNWNWVIVSSEEWQPWVLRLRLDQRSPAYTDLVSHQTFLEGALFSPQPRRTNELEKNYRDPFDQLLSLAVSHELGHAICRDRNEDIANRVAGLLRSGKHAECASLKSIGPIEELFLDSQSRYLRHLQ